MIREPLTPLLKTLEKKELVTRIRSKNDERFLVVTITDKGMELREKAVEIPAKIGGCISLDKEEAVHFYATLRKLLAQFDGE